MESPTASAGAEIARSGQRKFAQFIVALAAMSGVPAVALGAEPAGTGQYQTVVTAPAPVPTEPREDAAASASVITSDRTLRSAESLPLLLGELPGVHVTRYGGMGSLATLSLRGSTANQVQVYVDGVPLNTAAAPAVDLGLLTLTRADRIEVYRGMTPLMFGASGLGGVVSLTGSVPEVSGLSAYSGGGSFMTGFAGVEAAYAGATLGGLAAVNLVGSRGDFRYPSDNGTLFDPADDRVLRRQNNRLLQMDGVVRGSARLPGRRRLLSSLMVLRREKGLPASATVSSLEASLGNDRLSGTLAYESRDDLGPGGRLRAQAYVVLGEQRFHDEKRELSFVPTRTRDRITTAGATVTASRPLADWLRLSGMTDAHHEEFRPFDELAADTIQLPGSRTAGAAGVQADVLVSSLALDVLPSIRVEAASDEITHSHVPGARGAALEATDRVLPMARVGLVQRPSAAVILRANAGRYARLPSLMERYGNDGTLVGNPDLLPERGVNADAGARASWQAGATQLLLDGALFAAWVNDLIHFQKGTYNARYRNIGRARVLGAEAAADFRWRRMHVLAQATYTDARDRTSAGDDAGPQLPHRPRLQAYARPELRDVAIGGALAAGLYLDADVSGGHYLDRANLVRVPARVLFGAGASLSAPRTGLRLVASAYNLADSHVNDLVDFPLPGRSFFLTLHFARDLKPKETVK